MKKIKAVFINRTISAVFAAALLCGCSAQVKYTGNDAHYASLCGEDEFIDAVFVSYLDFELIIGGGSEAEYRAALAQALDGMSEQLGIDAVFFHARPFCDAMYVSDIFPLSRFLPKNSDGTAAFDPLEVLVDEAEGREMSVYAWVNPYRIGSKPSANAEFVERLLALDSNSVLEWGGNLYLNPASECARTLITDGVFELAEKYDVDGILFDDYFYPTPDAAFDEVSFSRYAAEGEDLADWRRQNVSELIADCYSAVKTADSETMFGISPDAKISRNYSRHYADVELWCSQEGYIDFVCPQIYFGFENETMPYDDVLAQWTELCKDNSVLLVPALAFYKAGSYDIYAGSGANEWTENFDVIARQVELAKECCAGVSYFRYGSMFFPSDAQSAWTALEIYNLQKTGF